jgi:T5SS/PEP-CTERM-associated repeat protein/autotransporter-associated beta strand protein
MAQTYTWTGAVNHTWDTTTANWSGAGSTWVNGNTRDAIFNAGPTAVTVGANITANNITFNTSGWSLNNSPTPRSITLDGSGSGVHVQTGTVGINVPIAGSVGLTKTGGGQLTLGAASTYSDTTTISVGTVALSVNNALPIATQVVLGDSGALLLGNITSQQVTFLNGGGTVSAATGATPTLVLDNDTFGVVYLGKIGGALRIRKLGDAVQQFFGDSTYSNGTSIEGGSLIAGNFNAFGTGSVTVAAGSTWALRDQITLSNAGTIAGTGASPFLGAIDNLVFDNTLSGLITLSAPATIASGNGRLTFTGGVNRGTNTLTFKPNGSGIITLQSSVIGTSGVFKTGTGTLELNSNISGITTVNEGVREVSGGGSVSTVGGLHVATEGMTGTVNVTGAGSVLNPGAFITVGDSLSGAGAGGNGTLNISNGGVVTINPPAKLTVGWVNATGTVNLNTGGVLEVGGTNGIQKHATGMSNFFLNGGTLRVIGSDLTTGVPMTLDTAAASTIDTNGLNATLNQGISSINAVTNNLNVVGAGSLSVRFVRTNGILTISNPRTNILAGRTTDNTSRLGGISVAPTSRFNLNDQDLIVDYEAGNSPLTNIAALLTTGYAGGAWNGVGIMSDVAAANSRALGYAEASDIFTSFPATFSGQTVDDSAVLIRYTRYGDADLNGTVNLSDFNALAAHFGLASGARWNQGDFNYDGSVNLSDFNLLAANFGLGASANGPTAQDWASLSAAVPEPTSLAALAIGVLTMLRRRSRRR